MGDRRLDVGRGVAVGVDFPSARRRRSRCLRVALVAALMCAPLAAVPDAADAGVGTAYTGRSGALGRSGSKVLPSLRRNLVSSYDFEHPAPGDPAVERDRGLSGTNIGLINGAASMRVRDGAFPGSRYSIRTEQVSPAVAGNDDWKAGIYSATGVTGLHAFNAAREISIMGWFKMTGPNPGPNTTTPDPADHYNAVGLAGLLSGDSQGHDVRALLEVINVSGQLRLVALGRRVDGSSSQTFAADDEWQSVLPPNTWVFLAATFDFDDGTMSLYKNGRPLTGTYVLPGDPWAVAGPPEPDLTSATDPRGIKIGGSFPQNTEERNPCNCRIDSLMFLDRAVTPREVARQYHRAVGR
ncbi:MAG TPA: LamG-like jellyroll fold domain-containing protein [Actinoallomurus sp.]|nr:LamG-like jellyroll fold domain-containing protein [Actinoallomurus sp.]